MKKYKYLESNCPKCKRELHIKKCSGCGRSCMCYWTKAKRDKYFSKLENFCSY